MTDLDMTDVQWHLAGMNEVWLDYHQIARGRKEVRHATCPRQSTPT